MTLTATALAGLLICEGRDVRSGVALLKPIASTGFVAAALSAGALHSDYGKAICVALTLSWCGDLCLIFRRSTCFLAGLVLFFSAHLAFGVAFSLRGQAWLWTAAAGGALLLPALLVARWLGPHLPPKLHRPVWSYIAAISAMEALAAGAVAAGSHPIVLAGGTAFYVSDLAVARDRFVSRGFANRSWGLPLYYAAQLMLASSVRF